jgi:uncharacterized phage protein gp47/JayE
MTDYGVQPDGSFQRKPVDDIIDDLEQSFKDALGQDIELRQTSPKKQLLDANAVEIARQWQALEGVYYASFYEDSFGEQLDKQLALAGFSRIPARSATGEVEFSREDAAPDDITIEAGTVVTTKRTETRPPIPFETTEGVILADGTTSVTAPVEALKPWQTELDERWLGEETNVDPGTIIRFEDPVEGVDSVTNPTPTGDESLGHVEGRDRETDAEFKLRYENSLAEGGASTVQAIKSNVFNTDEDVRSIKVDEVRDPNTGYGVNVIVLAPGVPDDTIAQAIVDSRAGGLESFGAESGTGTLDDGTEKTEAFDRATEATIYVDANVTTSSTFPSDGREQIENGIIRYIGGTANDNILYPGLEIGEDVVFDQVKRRVMEIQGVVKADVTIGTSDPPDSTSDIAIDDSTAAMTSTTAIDVTEV